MRITHKKKLTQEFLQAKNGNSLSKKNPLSVQSSGNSSLDRVTVSRESGERPQEDGKAKSSDFSGFLGSLASSFSAEEASGKNGHQAEKSTESQEESGLGVGGKRQLKAEQEPRQDKPEGPSEDLDLGTKASANTDSGPDVGRLAANKGNTRTLLDVSSGEAGKLALKQESTEQAEARSVQESKLQTTDSEIQKSTSQKAAINSEEILAENTVGKRQESVKQCWDNINLAERNARKSFKAVSSAKQDLAKDQMALRAGEMKLGQGESAATKASQSLDNTKVNQERKRERVALLDAVAKRAYEKKEAGWAALSDAQNRLKDSDQTLENVAERKKSNQNRLTDLQKLKPNLKRNLALTTENLQKLGRESVGNPGPHTVDLRTLHED